MSSGEMVKAQHLCCIPMWKVLYRMWMRKNLSPGYLPSEMHRKKIPKYCSRMYRHRFLTDRFRSVWNFHSFRWYCLFHYLRNPFHWKKWNLCHSGRNYSCLTRCSIRDLICVIIFVIIGVLSVICGIEVFPSPESSFLYPLSLPQSPEM